MRFLGCEIELSGGRKVPPEARVCFACGRGEGGTTQLVAGPDTFICDLCVAAARLVLAADTEDAGRSSQLRPIEGRRCSFCNSPTTVASAGGGAGICQSCVCGCQYILAEEPIVARQLPV